MCISPMVPARCPSNFSSPITKINIFPPACNKQRVASVELAVKAIEAATTQSELRSIKKECDP